MLHHAILIQKEQVVCMLLAHGVEYEEINAVTFNKHLLTLGFKLISVFCVVLSHNNRRD